VRTAVSERASVSKEKCILACGPLRVLSERPVRNRMLARAAVNGIGFAHTTMKLQRAEIELEDTERITILRTSLHVQ